MPSSCSARETTLNLAYVTRGLGLLLVCFLVLFVPFSGIDDDYGDVLLLLDANFRFLWLISSFSERAAEVLDGVDPRWCAVQ